MIGSIWVAALPFLRPIFAAGLFDIFAASAVVAIIAIMLGRRTGAITAGVAALLYAFAAPFWAETAGIEVYTLGMAILALLWLVFEGKSPHRWPLTIYLFGLSLANHPSALALAPALLFAFVYQKEYRRWKMLPIYALLLAICASIYLYLPIRAAHNPISNWGDPSSFKTLVGHMLLVQYSGWVQHSWENLWTACHLFYLTLFDSWWWIGIAAILSGIIVGWTVARLRTIMAIMIILTSLVLSASHQAINYEPFYLPSLLAALLLIANNFIWWENKFPTGNKKWVLSAVGLMAVLALLATNYRAMDKSDYTLAEDYGKLLLDSAEEGILLTAGDINSFPAVYLRYAEGYRPEVEVYDRSIRKAALINRAEALTGLQFRDYYDARQAIVDRQPIDLYLSKVHYSYEARWMDLRSPYKSHGLLNTTGSPTKEPMEIPTVDYAYDPGDPLSRQLLMNMDLARADHLQSTGQLDESQMEAAFRTALRRLENEPRGVLLNDIGICFRRMGLLDLALETYLDALTRPLTTQGNRKDIRFNISNVYKDQGNESVKTGNAALAVENYKSALEYDPANERLILNVGLLYLQRLSDTTNASLYFDQYLKIVPDDNRVASLVQSLKR